MKLSKLFKDLALTELSNLALADGGDISIQKREQITIHVNEALLTLHARFVLREKDLLIEMQEAVTNYHLLKKYAYSHYDIENPPQDCCAPYIIDLGREQFGEDVIKILSVYSTDGCKLPLNDLEKCNSVFTPQSTVLQVPFPVPGCALSIEYQASHPILNHENLDSEIQLPKILHSALKSHIAGQVFMHMNTQENTAKGQQHMMNFETRCQEVIDRDLVSSSVSTTNDRFAKRGWI